jgi:hypothetical protein
MSDDRIEFDKPAFVPTKLEEERNDRDIASVPLNPKERAMLDQIKKAMQQPKDATAIKYLAFTIGYNVIHGQSAYTILGEQFRNLQRNWKSGAPIDEPDNARM